MEESTDKEVCTFESLPKWVEKIYQRQERIESLLKDKENPAPPEPDTTFTLKELREYLPGRPSIQTIYTWTSQRRIPFHQIPGRKGLVFWKSEIDSWLKSGKRQTHAEINAEAETYVKKKGALHG